MGDIGMSRVLRAAAVFAVAALVPMVVGILTSLVAGWMAVWGTLRLLRTRTFAPFVAYRIALALVVFGLLASLFLPRNAARIESEGYAPPKDEESVSG